MASTSGAQYRAQAHWVLDPAQLLPLQDANMTIERNIAAKAAILENETAQAAENDKLKDQIANAYAYHRMLADDMDPSSDDGEYSSADDSDDSDSDYDGDSSDSDDNEGDDNPATVPAATNLMTTSFWKIRFNTHFLSPAYDKNGRCDNAILREGLWGRHPDFSNLTDVKMGLLSQLAHLCIAARIRACKRTACVDKAKAMEATAPKCDWTSFKQWAVTAMSCQASMEPGLCVKIVYAHITSAANGCAMMVKSFKDKRQDLQPFLDGEKDKIDLVQVMDIIYWMAKTQGRKGIGPRRFGHWTRGMLPYEVNLPPIEDALRYTETEEFTICKHRLWKLVDDSDRKQDDLPDIVRAIQEGKLKHKGHELCAANKCQESHKSTDGLGQVHKCLPKVLSNKDLEYCHEEIHFPVEQLSTAIELEKSTAWLCDRRRLKGRNDKHLAISHVWADGTGQKSVGVVNKCLFDYFSYWARELGCTAIWWDVISNPQEGDARAKALNKMHYNYREAEYTLIHDKSLLNVDWREDGTPCVALVLSSWFTRAWTALELAMSRKWRVKILFRDPKTERTILKDLDKDVLATSPETCSRVHWLATTLIQNLRKYPVDNVGDLLAILSPRSTSYVRDRTKIAALLADVPGCDTTKDESAITQDIIKYLGQIPYTCLMHGKPTMKDRGGFSWCAATLDDMPVDVSKDIGDTSETKYLSIDQDGAADGNWFCRSIEESETQTIHPYGDDLSSTVKVQVALRHWQTCLLLKVTNTGNPDLGLLVVPFNIRSEDHKSPVLECRYVGAVLATDGDEKAALWSLSWTNYPIRLGGSDSQPSISWDGKVALEKMDPTIYNHSNPSESLSGLEKGWIGHCPDWLRKSSSPYLNDQMEPVKPVPETPMHLCKAVIKSDKNAARWLVGNGVKLEREHLQSLAESCKNESLGKLDLVKINKLGDVLAEQADKSGSQEFYLEAITVYEMVNEKYDCAQKDKSPEISNTLDQYRVKYSLGCVYLKVGRMKEAEKLFTTVLYFCDLLAPSSTPVNINRLVSSNVKSSARATKALGKEEKKKQNIDTSWSRLRLNNIAKLTILYIGRYQFEDASRVFRRSLEESDKLKLQNDDEVFRINWVIRDSQPFYQKKDRDERMFGFYSIALQSADTMFHQKHILSLISSLYMGVNQSLQYRFQEANDLFERAESGFREQLKDSKHPVLALTLYHFGVLCMKRGQPDEARKRLDEAFGIVKPKSKHWLYSAVILAQAQNDLTCMPRLHKEAKERFESLRHPKSSTGNHDAGVVAQANLGLSRVLLAEGADENARKLSREKAKAFIQPFIQSINARETKCIHDYELQAVFAEVLEDLNELAEAEKKIMAAMNGFRLLNGASSLDYLAAMKRLSSIYEKVGRRNDAEIKLKEVIRGYEKTLGPHHSHTLSMTLQLGFLHLRQQKLTEAEILCCRARKGFDETHGPDDLQTMIATKVLADVYKTHGKFTEAKRLYAAYGSFLQNSGRSYSQTHKNQFLLDLGEVTALADDPGDRHRADEIFHQVEKSTQADAGLLHETYLRRGIMYKQQKMFEEAVSHIRKALAGHEKQSKRFPRDPILRLKVLETKLALGHVGLLRGKNDIHFDKLIIEAQKGIHEYGGFDAPLRIEATTVLAELYLSQKRTVDGERELNNALEEARKGLTPGHPTTVRLMNRLIGLYSDDRRHSAAIEALTTEMFHGLKEAYGEKDAVMIMHMSHPERPTTYRNDAGRVSQMHF